MPRGLATLGRSISPDAVEAVLRTSKPTTVIVDGIERQIFRSGSVEVITEQAGRIVVSILTY